MRPIVFLDIDDVMVLNKKFGGRHVLKYFDRGDGVGLDDWPELWSELILPAARANLRALHDEFNPEYVISSSWVKHFEKDQLIEIFERTGLPFVSENLHKNWMPPWKMSSQRVHEICWWLDKNDVKQYVVLDDLNSGYSLRDAHLLHPTLAEHVVFCDADIGFVYDKYAKAREILSSAS